MYNSGKARHNRDGEIVQPAAFQSRETPAARIEPHRKWFTNSRVVAQDSLSKFREAVKQSSDPYTYLLKSNKLPMGLIREESDTVNGLKQHAAKIAVEGAPFKEVFGPESRRKRVKLDVSGMEEMAEKRREMEEEYREKQAERSEMNGRDGPEQDIESDDTAEKTVAREPIFSKGQSKRIWNELYKVIDSSDVVIQVLDAREYVLCRSNLLKDVSLHSPSPEGTRCQHIEQYLKKEARHKHVLLVLNKTDLVPTKVAVRFPFLPSLIETRAAL